MWIRKKQRYLRRVALAFAVAAIAAPGAQASVANEGGGNSTTPAHSRPDDRGVRVGGGVETGQPYGAIEGRANYQSPPQVVASGQGGLDWGDVGIGGALTAALAGFGFAAVRVSGRMKPAAS
jgi:hypothetical protein